MLSKYSHFSLPLSAALFITLIGVAFAADASTGLPWGEMLMGLFGGLAFIRFGAPGCGTESRGGQRTTQYTRRAHW